MTAMRSFLVFLLFFSIAGNASSVSNSRQSCIRGAMAAGSAAVGNATQLNALYERYFEGERIAQLSAGKSWKRYSKAQKNAQRNRVRRFVIHTLAPSLSSYGGSRVKFISESGSKVKGVITAPNGTRRTVTWHFAGSCTFINVAIEGFGSLISFVGSESVRSGRSQ
jgi:ABC-type transporter MlaC component